MTETTNPNALVVKGNNLIMSRCNLSLAEQRLILQVASMIQKDDEDFKDYIVKVSDYLDLIDSNSSHTYEKMKHFTDTLLKKPLHIPQSNGNFLACNWFSSFEYIQNQGIMKCCFDPKLKPYLLQLKKNFTSYKLKNVLRLSSKYAIRLYEILKRYQGLKTVSIDLDEFKKLLAIPENYLYRDIKRRILKPFQEDFKFYTDIYFSFEEIKTSRKVTAIKFTISSNFEHEPQMQTQEPQEQELQEQELPQPQEPQLDAQTKQEPQLSDETKQQIMNLLSNIAEEKRTKKLEELLASCLQRYKVEYIAKQIEYTNKQKTTNYVGYLKKAIEEDYADAQVSQIEKERQQNLYEQRLKELEEEKQHDIEVYEYKGKFRIYNDYLQTLNDTEKQEFLNRYLEKAKELNPDKSENTYLMESQAETLAMDDLISQNKIYQERLAKFMEQAMKRIQASFDSSKANLDYKLAQNIL